MKIYSVVMFIIIFIIAQKEYGPTGKIINKVKLQQVLNLKKKLKEKFNSEVGKGKGSPINIKVDDLVVENFPDLEWSKAYSETPTTQIYKNDVHTVKISTVFEGAKKPPSIKGGPLKATYNLDHFHFHWGVANELGSEHTIDNYAYPLEIHAVHIQEGLDPKVAMKNKNGYSVIGYFVDVGEHSPVFDTIVKNFKTITKPGIVEINETFPLNSLLKPFNRFLTYDGSLTTEPWAECVKWIITPEILQMSQKQMDKFRILAGENLEMINNFREVQPLNARTIYTNKPPVSRKPRLSQVVALDNRKKLVKNKKIAEGLKRVSSLQLDERKTRHKSIEHTF